eukprot:9493209-Pyramimonas_sp.AAC.1
MVQGARLLECPRSARSRKAFEQITHHRLLQAAMATQFPLRQLKLLITLYRAPRILDLDGRASQVIHSLQSVIPGCHFATLMVQLALLQPLDAVASEYRTVHLGV